MPEKRRDKKGRILRDGENQRTDGRYEYKYVDANGTRHSVYSWKLVSTDPTPSGKQSKLSLREIEQKIKRDLDDGIDSASGEKTLNQSFEEMQEVKKNLRFTTLEEYRRVYNKHVYHSIGKMKVKSIRYSDIKKFYLDLAKNKGLQVKTVGVLHSIISSTLEIQVRNHVIRDNPAKGVYTEFTHDDSVAKKERKHGLTREQEDAFMSYVAKKERFQKWLPLFQFLLGTGCRIGEASGLCWEDCDFDAGIIHIRRSMRLAYNADKKQELTISKPKTDAGIRDIPMMSSVKTLLLNERMRQMAEGFSQITIGGQSGFVFLGPRKNLLLTSTVDMALRKIISEYNKEETETAKEENRPPEPLPKISAHSFRHTFCTRFCEHETDLKTIQEIMGHSSITTTMNVYNETTIGRKIESFKRLEEKLKAV